MVQDDGVNAAFALDAASINFRETAKRGLLLLNYDSRIKKERDRFPLHKFSMWRFKEATGSMNFCGVLELSIHLEGATSNAPRPFLYCSDPADFEYSFEAGRLCVTGTHDEIIDGCFALKPRSGLLDWINEYDQIITTSFSGFFTETPGASDQIQGLFVEHSEQELDVLAGNRAKVMAVLVASNLAAPGAADIDVSVRGALATYQRSRGIFASGFLDQVTFSELDRQRRPFR